MIGIIRTAALGAMLSLAARAETSTASTHRRISASMASGTPGSYSALADFRDMKLYPGGMVIGQQAWGVPFDRTATLTVAIGEASVSVGSTISRWSDPNPAMSSSLDLWPQSPDATGPRPAPTPAVEQVEHITGSWFCL